VNLLELTYPQVVQLFERDYGRGEFHAAVLYRAYFNSPEFSLQQLPAFAASPQLLCRVGRDLEMDRPAVVHQVEAEGVTKLVFRLCDGMTVETVIIPMAHHHTVCISSQVGCRMGCRFCETARLGLLRPLTVSEIVAQVYAVKVIMGFSLRNVVFMGMGEPLDNLDNVIQAIRGMEDGIRRLAALNWPQLKLAVSLNAADDAVRSALMPVNVRHPMAELKKALHEYPLARGNVLLIEYVLIKGINDRPEDARQLAIYLQGLPVRLNLIAYNPRCDSALEAPRELEINDFIKHLIDQKIFVRFRRSKGSALWAACGQLGRSLMT